MNCLNLSDFISIRENVLETKQNRKTLVLGFHKWKVIIFYFLKYIPIFFSELF